MAKFIPQLLLPEQKEYHAAVTNDLIQTITNEPDFLKKVITLKENEVSLSYVRCFLYLISSSVNASVFHSIWLDTFWAGLGMLGFSMRVHAGGKGFHCFKKIGKALNWSKPIILKIMITESRDSKGMMWGPCVVAATNKFT